MLKNKWQKHRLKNDKNYESVNFRISYFDKFYVVNIIPVV